MSASRVRVTPRTVDVLLCVGVVAVLSGVVSADQATEGPLNPVAYLWALGLGLLMLVRRSRPRLVLALTVCGFFSYYAAGFPAIGVAVPIAAALYSAAEAGYVRAAVATGVGVLAVSTAFRLLTGQSAAYVVGYELVGHVSLVASVIALGYSVRAHRALLHRTDQVTRLVAHQASLEAESREAAQRMRLARDLHDSLGHSLSVASLFSDVACEATDPDARTSALGQVRSATSAAMAQLRGTVSLLRSSDGDAAPAPDLADLARLMEAPRAVGYDVEVDLDEVQDVPDHVSTAAYRLVQEAVTNAIRHSSATCLQLGVRDTGTHVVVTVRDNGSRSRSRRPAEGHGLRGMRERVAELRGDLDVRADADGWIVTATLPKDDRR